MDSQIENQSTDANITVDSQTEKQITDADKLYINTFGFCYDVFEGRFTLDKTYPRKSLSQLDKDSVNKRLCHAEKVIIKCYIYDLIDKVKVLFNAIHIATKLGDIDLVTFLLELGANVNAKMKIYPCVMRLYNNLYAPGKKEKIS